MSWLHILLFFSPFLAFLAGYEIARRCQSRRRGSQRPARWLGRLRGGSESPLRHRAPANFSDPFWWIGHGGSVSKYR